VVNKEAVVDREADREPAILGEKVDECLGQEYAQLHAEVARLNNELIEKSAIIAELRRAAAENDVEISTLQKAAAEDPLKAASPADDTSEGHSGSKRPRHGLNEMEQMPSRVSSRDPGNKTEKPASSSVADSKYTDGTRKRRARHGRNVYTPNKLKE
jgi:peptidoglycan hydrolase CwlO-like protein